MSKIRCRNCFKEFDEEFGVCPYCGEVVEPVFGHALKPGTILNEQYYVGKMLGQGGFGITYKVYDMKLHVVRCIKECFLKGSARDEDELTVKPQPDESDTYYKKILPDFLKEARTLSSLKNNSHIVHVLNYFKANNTAYMVMEFLEGYSLKDEMQHYIGHQFMPISRALDITNQVLEGLKSVHAAGLIHRDIKPANIYICNNQVVKLIDFGNASIGSKEQALKRQKVGSKGYAAPEQYYDESKQSAYTDIYALGSVLYEMITNVKLPDSIERTVNEKDKKETLKEPIQIRPEITQALNNAIMRAIAVDYKVRYQSAGVFQSELKKKNVRSLRQELARLQRRRVIISGIIVAALFIVAFTGYNVYRSNTMPAALDPVKITLWVKGQDDSSSTKAMYEDILEDFHNAYPQVTIKKTIIPEDEYEAKITAALDEGHAPTLFESTDLDKDYKTQYASLNDTYKRLDQDDCYYVEDYKTKILNTKQFPVTFTMPVVIQNFYSDDTAYRIKSIDDLGDSYLVDKNLTTASKLFNVDEATLHQSNDDLSQIQSLFENNQLQFYIVNASSLKSVKASISNFGINKLMMHNIPGDFFKEFSISKNANGSSQKAASELLSYFLSDNAQDVLTIRNDNGLPLNKNIMKQYCTKVVPEMNDAIDNLECVQFNV